MTGPLIVTLYSGPGAGKSTLASMVFSALKLKGLNAELVHEYAKDLTWERAWRKLAHQPLVAAEQMWRLDRLEGQVEVVVTDTSTLLGLIYGKGNTPAFNEWLVDDYKRRRTFNAFIGRSARPYNPVGRRQSVEEAIHADQQIKQMLTAHGIPHYNYNQIDYTTVQGCVDHIVRDVETELPPRAIAAGEIAAAPIYSEGTQAPLCQNTVEFYSVRHRRKVAVPESEITPKTYERETSKGVQTRYALQADTSVDGDNVRLTKFISEEDYNSFGR